MLFRSAGFLKVDFDRGGPSTFNVVWTTAKFREQNPRLYKAFLSALEESMTIINAPDKKAVAQLWIDVDDEVDVVELLRSDDPVLRPIALFDVVVNNADRKAGHLLPVEPGRILGVDHVLAEAGDPGAPAQRRHHGRVVAHPRLAHQAAGEQRAEDALVDEVLVQGQLATSVECRHLRARARTAR